MNRNNKIPVKRPSVPIPQKTNYKVSEHVKLENDKLKAHIKKLDDEKLDLLLVIDSVQREVVSVEDTIKNVKSKYEQAKVLVVDLKKNQDILAERDRDLNVQLIAANNKLNQKKLKSKSKLDSEKRNLRKAKEILDHYERKLAKKTKEFEVLTKYSDQDEIKRSETDLMRKQKEFQLLCGHVDGLLELKFNGINNKYNLL